MTTRLLDDPVLWKLAEIVHEGDIEDGRYDAPEAPGLDVLLRGLSMVITDDQRVLALTGPLFDGLYEYHRGHCCSAVRPPDPGRHPELSEPSDADG